MSLLNLIGQRFGKLQVVSRAPNYKNGGVRWNCICDCGEKVIVYSDSLRRNVTKNCNLCSKRLDVKDLTNCRFEKLKVINQAGRDKNNFVQWNCLCDCGKKCVVLSKCLTGGNTKSCGCLDLSNKYLDKSMSSKKSLFRKYRRSAEERNLVFKIDFEKFMGIIKKKCYYCNCPPNNYYKIKGARTGFKYNGIDRLENKKGYLLNNIVPCCKNCNYLKWDRSENEFYNWIMICYARSTHTPKLIDFVYSREENPKIYYSLILYIIFIKSHLLREVIHLILLLMNFFG